MRCACPRRRLSTQTLLETPRNTQMMDIGRVRARCVPRHKMPRQQRAVRARRRPASMTPRLLRRIPTARRDKFLPALWLRAMGLATAEVRKWTCRGVMEWAVDMQLLVMVGILFEMRWEGPVCILRRS